MATIIGVLPTFLIVIATAVVGITLLKRQGVETFRRFQMRLSHAQVPFQEITEGLLLFFAGGLLLTPGLVTDVIGFFILLPAGRKMLSNFLGVVVKSQIPFADTIFPDKEEPPSTSQKEAFTQKTSSAKSSQSVVIEGEYEDVTRR